MLTNEHKTKTQRKNLVSRIPNLEEPYGMLTFEAPKEINLKVLKFLYDDAN